MSTTWLKKTVSTLTFLTMSLTFLGAAPSAQAQQQEPRWRRAVRRLDRPAVRRVGRIGARAGGGLVVGEVMRRRYERRGYYCPPYAPWWACARRVQ